MSAKLSSALAKGTLKVLNKTNGEVMLYYPDPKSGKQAFMVIPPNSRATLTDTVPVAAWRKSANLKTLVSKGVLYVES